MSFDVAAAPMMRKLPLALLPLAAVTNMAALFGLSLALVPLARPFRLSRVALSYGAPLIPALFAWDGTVSALRAYTPEELLALTRSLRVSNARFKHLTGWAPQFPSAREGLAAMSA